jgi:Fe-S cluster biogenesis protein NfuA
MKSEITDVKITGQPTLDPNVCKFIVSQTISTEGTVICRNREMAEGSLLLEKLFAIDGIREILISRDTLTIAKNSSESWPELGKKIGLVIRESINSGQVLINPEIKKKLPSEDKIRQTIEELFEREVNPAIAAHGGRVELADVDGTKVYLRLSGGCQGCSSATVTLRQGIEKAIRATLPDITEIHDITDHASGTNPYYT